ncbi:hypothetical protein [Sinomonas humi]|uniref:Uncharacterized protein n=1 Tax=Sinomonas humi TaxID=1338436 RepID=A0A0B2AB82_9MICC|nr:hypothetical protein [Sinomonas humi]KHL00430.1 hypothetical protein LK10_19655 [Sinomonas humi]
MGNESRIDPRLSTQAIREAILAEAAERGETISSSRADRLAKQYRHETEAAGPISSPRRQIEWQDPTGNRAAHNIDTERREQSRRSSHARKEG